MPLITEIQVAGVEDARRQLIEFFNAFKEGTQDAKTLNSAMREIAQPIYGMRRALSLARTEWRLTHQTMIEASRIMRDVGRIGRTITSIFTTYTVAQIRLAQAQRDYEDAVKDVAEAQAVYNHYLEVFGKESVFTQRAYEQLQNAIEKQKQAEEELQRTQQATIMGYVGIGLQVSELIATVPTMIKHVNDLRIALSTANTSASTLATTLGTISAVLSGIFLGVEAAKALAEAFGEAGAAASMIIGSLIAISAVLAAIALHVSIMSFGGAAIAGIAAFGAAMAMYGGYLAMAKGEYQHGGYVPETGLYVLHAGEYVVPANKAETATAPKIINIRMPIYINQVTSEIDLENAVRRATDKVIERIGEKW